MVVISFSSFSGYSNIQHKDDFEKLNRWGFLLHNFAEPNSILCAREM